MYVPLLPEPGFSETDSELKGPVVAHVNIFPPLCPEDMGHSPRSPKEPFLFMAHNQGVLFHLLQQHDPPANNGVFMPPFVHPQHLFFFFFPAC